VSPAQAAPMPANPGRLAKIHQLLDSYHFAESIEQDRVICIQQSLNGVFSPESVAKEKGRYRGFKPGTAAWPKVLVAYKVYLEKYCSYYDPKTLEQSYMEFYDSRLSDADLDAYLAFQKTPAAQHMAAAQHDALAFLAAALKKASDPVVKAADDDFTKSLSVLCDQQPWYSEIFCFQ